MAEQHMRYECVALEFGHNVVPELGYFWHGFLTELLEQSAIAVCDSCDMIRGNWCEKAGAFLWLQNLVTR